MNDLPANRLTQIVTRTGDDGNTSLANSTRVSKFSDRIETIGTVDELNSFVGLALVDCPTEIQHILITVQHELFDIGSELAVPDSCVMTEYSVLAIEQVIKTYNAALPELKEFVLPGGTRAAAALHVCRTIARRAERQFVKLADSELLSTRTAQYLNRLSDLFFVLARTVNSQASQREAMWIR
jgi:cob(I)alamin adenosyltransferase